MYAAILSGKDGISSMIGDKLETKFSARKPNFLLMELRKICNHPYMIEGSEPEGTELFGEHIV